MTTIPERIREEARKMVPDGVDAACRAVIEANAMYALLAAEKRGREEAAKIADDYSERAIKANPPAQEASAAAQNIAAAIRSTN